MSQQPQSAAAAYQFPAGHLGHLNADQRKSFEAFKQLLAERKVYTPAASSEQVASHDDATILRFLRARRFDLEGAYKQFSDTEKWRQENDIGGLYRWIDRGEYEDTRRLYPQWIGRRDKRGMPVYVFEVAHLNAKAVAAYEQSTTLKNAPSSHTTKTPAKLLRLFALYENLTRFVLPWCSAASDRPHAEDGTPVTQANNIVDISGVGIKQFWDLKGHLQDASTLATAHYPETLDRIFIIGAPSFFPTIWSWVKRWFDPIVVSKMFILGDHEVLPTLSQFMDPKDIPEKYGGQLKFRFGDMPNLDPKMSEMVDWQNQEQAGVPIGTIVWEEGKGGEMQMVNVGGIESGVQSAVVGTLKDVRWREVMFPGSGSATAGSGQAPNSATAASSASASTATSTNTAVESGDAAVAAKSRTSIDTVPAIPTSAGPPVQG